MATLTNFNAWLDEVSGGEGIADFDIYCLYKAATDRTEWGCFTGIIVPTVKGNMTIVRCSSANVPDILLLASPKAEAAFLQHLRTNYTSGQDIEAWFADKDFD